ncbi:tannase/feruloyl esterase family alpha/beta hydrolase [Sphingomonas sp. BAUL-RG-20F-R05-02]|uniref:tannase/feruloyl esterase family alpha/beta hydrolase n=1 Tax=Sphingomonas sp. BAUL-RG-20F-R05-02 TaxID=2914830 RepID=UPI001F581B9B|nr:tannase/feruloyl esterase family alpha/beta hydrolase [Sphingomonas sp. BAUL-RG-20F-R05-02]
MGIVADAGGIPGILTSGLPSPLGPPNASTSIDLDARLGGVRADAMQTLTDTYTWTNLSTFLDPGGKIIWYHGVSDPWFSANDTLDYYERAAAANGKRFLDSSRLYMVPGAGHCGGGANTFDQFDLLTALDDWVEADKAPGSIPARRKAPTPAERPLCPYPTYPFYLGGDESRIESFQCRS